VKKFYLRNKIKIITFIASIFVAMLILFIYFHTLPEPTPRNVRILVSGNISSYHTILELNENTFDVVVFLAIDNPIIEDGFFSIENFEMFDEAMVDDFAESLSWWWFSTPLFYADRTTIIVETWTTELSQQQLNDVWRIMDKIVNKYDEPSRENFLYLTGMKIIIDDEFFWGRFLPYFNPQFTRTDRHDFENTDINLLRLTYYLADTSPVKMGWEYSPHLIFRRPES
jgi:hypothetical protein